MDGFAPHRGQVNGFLGQGSDPYLTDRADPYTDGGWSLPSADSDSSLSLYDDKQRPLPIRKGKGKGKNRGRDCDSASCTITLSDVPTHLPIKCAFCHEWGHHLTLCLKAFKDRLDKVETHCKHGFHKPWFHDGIECRCRYCGVHLRHLDKDA